MRALAERNGEKITRQALGERDGFICHLCGGKTRSNVTSLHEKYGTIDHLIPISAGGSHTWDNVAWAHRGCNIRRGNKGIAQLRLVG